MNKQDLTSRERILMAINHREPDRVPVDLGATPSSGISALGYDKLKKLIGMDSHPTLVYDVVQQLAQPHMQVLDKFGVDVVDAGRAFNASVDDWYDVQLLGGVPARYPTWFRPQLMDNGEWVAKAADGTPIAKMPSSGTFFDQIHFPYVDGYPSTFANLDDAMSKVLWAAFVHSPWDHISDKGFWETLRAKTKQLRASTDKALMISVGCNLFEWGTFLRRLDLFLMDLLSQPGDVERLLDELMVRHLAFLENVCSAVGDLVDIMRLGDDLGMDSGPFMAPKVYEQHFKPRHTVLCEYIHKHSGAKTFIHSCGSVYLMIPHLIEAGVDILNPVQTNCHDMEPQKLKDEFGGDIVFWGGGCDTRTILNNAVPAEVKSHVRERLDIVPPSGTALSCARYRSLPSTPR